MEKNKKKATGRDARGCGKDRKYLESYTLLATRFCLRLWRVRLREGRRYAPTTVTVLMKRYPEPMAHGPEACEPSHPLWPMAQRPASRHTRAEAVDTGYLCSLTREIWNPISNQ